MNLDFNGLKENIRPSKIVLDNKAVFEISGSIPELDYERWGNIAYCKEQRYSLKLFSAERLTFCKIIKIDKDSALFLRFSAGCELLTNDLLCEISVSDECSPHDQIIILTLPIYAGVQNGLWRLAEVELGWLAQKNVEVSIHCYSDSKKPKSTDCLAIAEFCVSRKDDIELNLARTFPDLRSKNEIEHFSSVYRHEMYSRVQNQLSMVSFTERPVRKVNSAFQGLAGDRGNFDILKRLNLIEPLEEAPYDYASRALGLCIQHQPPDFIERLKKKSANQKIKVLSLCSGAARIEAGFSSQVGSKVEWTLLDINCDLLNLASKQFSAETKLELIEANANNLEFFGEKFDVILCVSALHHIVELERLFKFCHDSLNTGGEFWSIGENIGRNGNRLWADSLNVANQFFGALPSKYRYNHHTGRIDLEIPDNDYSVSCFEGIRSEHIERVLDIWFQQEHIYRRNCFLWRLVNLAYSDNYNLNNNVDRLWLHKAIQEEYSFYMSGGRGTELFGVYRPRLI